MSQLHPVMKELTRTVHRLYRVVQDSVPDGRLVSKFRDVPRYRHGEVERLLRVEVNDDVLCDIIGSDDMRYSGWKWDDALTLRGVSVYLVRHRLPECGWRIVDPTVAPASEPRRYEPYVSQRTDPPGEAFQRDRT